MTPKEVMQALLDGKKVTYSTLDDGEYFMLDKEGYLIRENGEKAYAEDVDLLLIDSQNVKVVEMTPPNAMRAYLENHYQNKKKDSLYNSVILIIDYLERLSK